MSVINTHIFGRIVSVSCTITQRFGDPEGFPRLMNPGVHLCVFHQHSQFWPILTCFVDYYSQFWGPEVISIVVEPKARLRVGHQHYQFWPILARLMDYYSPFWGPEAISIVVEPQGVLTCWSSTITVLAHSGPFHGLLLTVLGFRTYFHD